jgi:hypothetical protein
MERAIAQLLVHGPDDRPGRGLRRKTLSSLAAFFYLALFRTVRDVLQPFLASNPTWIKLRVDQTARVDLPFTALVDCFRQRVELLRTAVVRNAYPVGFSLPEIKLASSSEIPLANSSVDAVVGSPPYCTRIDYAVATLPELAVLGFTWSDVQKLRSQLIGTPTMIHDPGAQQAAGDGVLLRRLLRRIDRHGSYAARTYYLPFYRQYFTGMRRSLEELHRVTRAGSPIVFVVQDSWFKDVPIETPSILTEIAGALGWRLVTEHHFKVRTRATMHPHRATRRTSRATETVTLLTR